MIKVEQEYFLNVPQQQVFEYLSQPVNDSEWQSSCKEVRTGLGTPGVGFCYTICFRFLSREMIFDMEVFDYQPYRSFGYRTVSGPMAFRGFYRFEAVDNATRLHWTFEAEPGGFFGIVPQSVLKKVLTKQVQADLSCLEKLLSATHAVEVA